jgi:lactoylglutathione lyase
MNIEHIAIRTADLERLRSFYETYFHAQSGTVYSNPKKQFTSRFLTFSSGCRIELMQYRNVPPVPRQPGEPQGGLAHLAFSVGSKEAVDALTQRLVDDGFEKLDGPRITGDGYYESAFLDPDGNVIEITV